MAYTYTGTPNQRIEQAKRRISTESVDVNSTLSAYQNRVAEIQQQEQAQAQEQEYKSNASGIVRFSDTLGEFFKDVATGIEKAFEGIIDFGAGTIGTIAGWAGNNNLKQEMTNFVSRDLIGEQWDAARNAGLDVDFDDSYINDLSETGQGIVKGVAEGIGQMLPMVVATVATGGAAGAAATAGKISAGTANAIVKAGQVANMVGLGASAAGRGTEEALNTEIVDEYGNVTKPTLDRAYLYGLATGAVEMATEKLVGGIYSKAVGGGIADNLISKLAKSSKFSKAVKFGLDVMGEGVEEMVSASVEKTLQTIYNSTDGKMHWENPDIQDVFVSGVVGTLTSAVMGGGQVAVRKASSVATTQDAMLDIENTLKKANNLSKKGKLAEQAEALESEINKNAEVIARRYQRASDKGKERLLAIQGVRELLAEDGSVRKTALNEGVAEISREKAVGAMSGSLALTRRNEVANVVAAQNTTIAESLDTEQKSNFAKLEKMLALTGKEAGKQMKVVALEKHEANAFIKDDVMYISKDRLADKNATARDFAHEVFHFAEGTKEYRDVAKLFDKMSIDGKNLFDLATDEVKSLGYEVDAKVFEMLKEGKTAEEITNAGISERDVRLALSEIRAKQSEMMFGNAEVINKMAEADQSLAKKILKRIKESIKVIEAVFKGDKETLETLKVLRQAEKLWQDALAVGGMKRAKAQGKITVEGVAEDGSVANEYEQVIQMSRASKELAEKLDKEGHETVYRAMQVIDGKLYPPMAAKIDGKLVEPTQFNVWYQADEHPELVDKNGKFKLDKANGSSISAAYNPYWHTSRSMLNDQFSSAYKRPNLVVVECEVPTSELTSNYKAEGAKDAVGEVNWHSGVVSSKLRGEKARKVILSRYVKVKRIVPNTEVAKNIAQLLEGTNISIPINVVTPSLREALLDEGVEISGVKGLQADVKERVKAEGIDISNPEERARISEVKFSRAYANDITDGHYDENGKLIDAGQRQANEKYGLVEKAVLDKAIKEQHEVVDMLNKIDDFLPEDEKEYDVLKKHKVIKSNGSYGRSVENTTICVRTLAYNQFVNKVQRVLKRPMTASESFLVSQMLYKIAKEPQCLYCYVSLDRKAYNEFLLKYLTERNKVIDRYKTMTEAEKKVARQVPTDADFVKTTSAYNKNKSKNPLYADFIKGKKNTAVMQERFSQWLALIDSGAAESDILSLEDVATTDGMKEIEGGENLLKQAQLQDAREYAQNASWAKVQEDYIAYYDEIRNPKKMSQELIDTLNREFGLRFYSFSDYSPAFILENMQQITDASIRGLKGMAYTKDLDFVKIFAKSGININVSVFIRSRINQNGEVEYYVDGRQSAVGEGNHKHTDLNELLKLRNEYNNVGIVAVATDDKMVEWACEQKWTDVVIPFHIVRTGQDVAVNYGWTNYRSQQGEKKANKKLFEDWIKENENKSVEVFPTEHNNDYKTYIDLCSKKGVHPKFYKSELYRRALRGDETDQKNYMKLVVETRLSAEEVKPMQPIFNMDAVKSSIDQFVEDGGYHDGYYKEGVDVEEAVQKVAGDVERISEGKMKYSDVDYAYLNEEQVDKMMTDRKSVREHQSMNPDIRYSKRKDSEGHQLTEAQEDFFKDSKVRDENGNLLVVYHGTRTAGFTEFAKSDDIGYFFTNKENNAFTYAGTPTKFEPIIFNNWEEATEYISKNDLGELRYDEESSTYLWDDGWTLIEYAEDEIRRIADDVQSYIYYGEGSKGIYEVYLNLTNPLVINGNGSTWAAVSDYYEGGKWVKYDELSMDDIKKFEDKGYEVDRYEYSIEPLFDVINYEMAFRQSTREWVEEAKNMGCDGVIFKDIYDSGAFGGSYSIESDVYVALDSNQIKSIDNKTPTNDDDIRYSKRSFGDTKTKVELLKSLQGMQLDYYGKYYAKIEDPASFFEEGSLGDRLANQILAMADEAEPNKYAFANDLATHIVNNLAVTTVDDYGLKMVLDNANAIREYRHKLNLDGIKGEIQYRYGKKNNIFALWKARKGTTGTYIMDAVNELRYKGVIINAEVDADAFFEMLDMVEFANEQANKVLSGTAKDYLKADEYDALVEGLRDDILSFMENKGTKAEWENYYKTITRQADAYLERAKQKARDIEKLATLEAENALEKAKHAFDKDSKKLQHEYETKIKELTNEMQMQAYYDIEYNKQYNKMMDKVWSEANSLTLDNIKKYKNASDLLNKELAGAIKTLSGIKYRGELKNAGARKIFAKFSEWYNTNNPLLTNGLSKEEIDQMMSDEKVTQIGYLDKFVLEGLELLKENQTRTSLGGKTKGQQIPNNKPLTYQELLIAQATLASARHILKEYNTLQIAQKRVNLSETATQTEHIAKILSGVTHLKHKATNKVASVVLQGVTPADVIAYQFGYQDNALSDLFKEIQDGETHARAIEIELKDIVDNFFKEHKSYKKTLSNKVKFGSYEIRKDIALSLYMESLQADAREGLLLGGWGYRDEDGYWKEQGTLTENDLQELSQALSTTDKDFTKVLRKFFDKAGEEMIETDHLMKGYSLVENSDNKHYFPIKRYAGDMAKPVADAEASKNAMAVSVANASFTKERVKNIRRLDILPVMSVVNTHARQVSLYTGLALPIREFQRLYNYNTSTDGSTTSVRNTLNEKVWNGVNNYITKLLSDIQGIREQADGVSKVLGKVRSNYAKFQLGANIKTWFSQLSGYPAAFPYLSLQSMAKAFTKSLYWNSQNAKNLLKYCEWAKVKSHDGGVVLVETLSDKVGVVGDIATKPIQLMDNFLNRILWNASQFEIERTKGFKFGTKENMELAGELHTLIGRKTQGNAATSELSAMQRHRSEIVKGFAMFNSDGFKLISRLFEAINRVRVQNYLAKHHPEMVTEKSQKEAKTFLAKTTTAILTSALIYTLVGELFKFLYDKDRKDKEGNEIGFAEDFGMSYLSTVVGMIPIIRDVYSLMVEGYEVDNYAIEGLTNFSDAFGGVIEGLTILASGEPFESKDLARPLKDLVNALGQITGIPTRNVYNTIYGLTKRFDASAAYKWDSIFYAQGYTKDLKKAIEKDDVDLQKTIIGLMLKDNGLTDTSEKVNNKLRELYAEGYTVLPKTVQDTLHYDGETYNLSNKQVKQFKAVYGKANEEVEDLVNDRHFTSLAAEVQAQAIKWIYDYYYESAVFDTIGEEADSKKQLFGETMDVSKFALTIAACKSIESKLDKKGNVIAGSRKIQIQRLLASLNLSPAEKQLILAYLGYSVADQETLIKAFIRRIGLTKAQQKLLLSYCGIAV